MSQSWPFCKSEQKTDKTSMRNSARNNVNLVDKSDSDEEYVFTLNSDNQTSTISVTVGGIPTDIIIDSGASCRTPFQ